jgi:hypothetical protein
MFFVKSFARELASITRKAFGIWCFERTWKVSNPKESFYGWRPFSKQKQWQVWPAIAEIASQLCMCLKSSYRVDRNLALLLWRLGGRNAF